MQERFARGVVLHAGRDTFEPMIAYARRRSHTVGVADQRKPPARAPRASGKGALGTSQPVRIIPRLRTIMSSGRRI